MMSKEVPGYIMVLFLLNEPPVFSKASPYHANGAAHIEEITKAGHSINHKFSGTAKKAFYRGSLARSVIKCLLAVLYKMTHLASDLFLHWSIPVKLQKETRDLEGVVANWEILLGQQCCKRYGLFHKSP